MSSHRMVWVRAWMAWQWGNSKELQCLHPWFDSRGRNNLQNIHQDLLLCLHVNHGNFAKKNHVVAHIFEQFHVGNWHSVLWHWFGHQGHLWITKAYVSLSLPDWECGKEPPKELSRTVWGSETPTLYRIFARREFICKKGNYGSDLLVRYSISRSSPIMKNVRQFLSFGRDPNNSSPCNQWCFSPWKIIETLHRLIRIQSKVLSPPKKIWETWPSNEKGAQVKQATCLNPLWKPLVSLNKFNKASYILNIIKPLINLRDGYLRGLVDLISHSHNFPPKIFPPHLEPPKRSPHQYLAADLKVFFAPKKSPSATKPWSHQTESYRICSSPPCFWKR